jgi:protein-tyrosine phosphatase
LIRGPLPLVFNCSAGKDRTGVATALVLTAIGVPWDIVVGDYLISATTVRAQRRILESGRGGAHLPALAPATVDALLGAETLYLEAMRAAIEEKNGSVKGYLTEELQLTEDDLVTLKSRLVA